VHVDRITLAAQDPVRMVAFYDATFGTGMAPISGSLLLVGQFAGIAFVLCPNEVAGVVAEQSRHQFRLEVEHPAAVARMAVQSGGALLADTDLGGRRLLAVADPEGNTYELIGPGA
jgi:catechol 2,3-dioxygenase-like lactoylglutathione lyase family enzyme